MPIGSPPNYFTAENAKTAEDRFLALEPAETASCSAGDNSQDMPLAWISTINPKQTIGLLGHQSRQSYRRDIPTSILLYGEEGALCFKMHSLLPFDEINKTKGSVTDCDIVCDKSNTLGGDYVPHPFR